MSALPRGSRSRSRPATDTKQERHSNRATTIPVQHSSKSSNPHSTTTLLCPPSANRSKSMPSDVVNMVDTIVVQKALDSLSAGSTAVVGSVREQSADQSSSLSELEDNPDEREDFKNSHSVQQSDREDDSEAETEKLEQTPRKQHPDLLAAYTPSRLGNEISANDEEIDAASSAAVEALGVLAQVANDEANDNVSPSSPLSDDPDAIPTDLPDQGESTGRKRKRGSGQDTEENDADSDEPARKRSGGLESDPAETREDNGNIQLRQPLEESPPPLDSVENEDEGVEDQPIPVKVTRGKKQKGKGRKGRGKANEATEKTNNTAIEENTVEAEESGEVEVEDDDTGSPTEQLLQKRVAFDKFAGLDAAFKALREDLLDEQIARLDQELIQINQNPCQHPEYLAMMTCINARRDDAITKEQYLLFYKEKDLRTRFVAERHIVQSQYVQTAREVREQAAGNCYSKLYALQRDRRRWGADDKIYGYIYNPKRSDQIKQQRAYNTEVSLLSGMAKYVGFPAAPEIKGLREDEVDEDLIKMGIQLQQTQMHPYATHTHAENWRQTYPMNSSLSMDNRTLSNPFTPAGQLRQVDVHAPNGSASTIDMNSNLPSGAPGVGSATHVEMVRQESTETPLPAQVRRVMSGQQNSPFYTANAPAIENYSPVPNRAAVEASTAFAYVSPSHRNVSDEPNTNVLRNELAEAARRETPLQRMRAAVGAAGGPALFSR